MKITAIDGSPRENGNTEKLVWVILDAAHEQGIDVTNLKLARLNVNACKGCLKCRATGKCETQDDMDRVISEIHGSDIVVIGSPIYMGHVTGQTKIFMDRLCRLIAPDFQSRLNGQKRTIFVYTQGNPDSKLWQPYFEHIEKMFVSLGFQNAGRVVAAGTRDKDDLLVQRETMSKARALCKKVINL